MLDTANEKNKLNIPAEVLINLVKQRPCLWDKSLSEYKDKMCRNAAWTDIYRTIEPDFDKFKNTAKRQIGVQVTKKWCNIRDAYVKARNNYRLNKANRPYVYTKMLSFLDPFISEKTVEDRLEERLEERLEMRESEAESEGAEQWYNETVYLEEEPAAKKPKVEMDLERDKDDNNSSAAIELDPDNVIAILTKIIKREDDEDRAFFKSIEPCVKGLSEDSKLQFRIHVLKLIKKLRLKDRTDIHVSMKMTDDSDC